jgi:RNA polymerase primary sigma factor
MDDSSAIRAYMALARQHPLLTPDQERELASRIAAGQAAAAQLTQEPSADPAARQLLRAQVAAGQAAREQFILANLRLAALFAYRYSTPDLSAQGFGPIDLIQEAIIGLIRAVETFDPARGTRFSTYAAWWIRQAVSRSVADKGRLIRLPVHVGEERRAARRAADLLAQALGREPCAEEIAAVVGCSVNRLVLGAIPDADSLNRSLEDDDERTLETVVADEHAVAPEDAAEQQALAQALRQALASLSARDRRVLELHYGLADGRRWTYEEIAPLLGVIPQRVHQIQARALRRLRQPARALDLGAFLGLATEEADEPDRLSLYMRGPVCHM